MATIRGNTVSATQARDLYNLAVPMLTAQGWVDVTGASPVTYSGIEWHVWRNPATNSGLPGDYHVAIGFATSGTGNMFFRMFETWLGLAADPVASKYEYGCKRPVPVLANSGAYNATATVASPDAWGRDLQPVLPPSGRTVYTIPITPVFRHDPADIPSYGPAQFASWTDFSLGIGVPWISSGSYQEAHWNDAAAAFLDAHKTGGIPLDFRSKYVQQITLTADDETAVEYVLHVSPKCIAFATRRIFNDTVALVYAGRYEEAPAWDPMPITLHQGVMGSMVGQGSFTRNFKFTLDQPHQFSTTPDPPDIYTGAYPTYVQQSWEAGDWFPYTGRDGQPTTNPPGTASVTRRYKGPLAARVGIIDMINHFRGLLPDNIMSSWQPIYNDAPLIEFGDETTVNGQQYIYLGHNYGTSDGAMAQTKNIQSFTNYQWNYTSFWVKKD